VLLIAKCATLLLHLDVKERRSSAPCLLQGAFFSWRRQVSFTRAWLSVQNSGLAPLTTSLAYKKQDWICRPLYNCSCAWMSRVVMPRAYRAQDWSVNLVWLAVAQRLPAGFRPQRVPLLTPAAWSSSRCPRTALFGAIFLTIKGRTIKASTTPAL